LLNKDRERSMQAWFAAVATKIAQGAGSSWAFIIAALVVISWAISGPIFGFSDTWQLVINTGTTIVTFLMVFLIQNTQNRDTRALHLKLDELLRAVEGAREAEFADLEDLDEQELEKVKQDLLGECRAGESPEEHQRHAGTPEPNGALTPGRRRLRVAGRSGRGRT
jgi:low affinity Fe/Cu permease